MLCLRQEQEEKHYITVPPSDKPTVIVTQVIESNHRGAKVGYTAPSVVVIDRESVHRERNRQAKVQATP